MNDNIKQEVQSTLLEESPSFAPIATTTNGRGVTGNVSYYKVHTIRWFVLFLLVMCEVCISIQYVQYTIIANVVADFYGVSYEVVDWSIMILMVIYAPLNIVGVYCIQKIGIRRSVIIGIFGASLATWIKLCSISSERYWIVLLGQAVVAFSQLFILPLPAQFASVWFGRDQVALATGIGFSGVQIGVALGFVLPPMVVKANEDKAVVAYSMYVLSIGFAFLCSAFLLLTVCFFKSKPPSPPSRAQDELQHVDKAAFMESTKRIFRNRTYITLLITYTISGGTYNTIPALLNQIILYYFPDGSEDAGRIGLVMLITAIFGQTLGGYLLDRFQQFKTTTVAVMLLYLLGMFLFTFSLGYTIPVVYAASLFLGASMSATNGISLQVAAQLTYPEPESISTGFLLASAEIAGIASIHIYSFVFYKFGPIWANLQACVDLAIAATLIITTPFDARRKVLEDDFKNRC